MKGLFNNKHFHVKTLQLCIPFCNNNNCIIRTPSCYYNNKLITTMQQQTYQAGDRLWIPDDEHAWYHFEFF